MRKTALFVLFSSFFFTLFSASFAGETDESYNGNLIPEPALNDYVQGSRAPGIMGAPTDITDLDGNLVSN